MLDLTAPQNYLSPVGIGATVGTLGGKLLPRGSGFGRGAIRGAVSGVGATVGGEMTGRAAEHFGVSPAVANLFRILGAGAGGYTGYRLAKRFSKTPREKVQDDADAQVDSLFRKTASVMQSVWDRMAGNVSPTADNGEDMKTRAALAGAGLAGRGILGAGIGAIGGAAGGSGFIPGGIRGALAGAGSSLGEMGADALTTALGVKNPYAQVGSRALGMLLGGVGGYRLGRRATKTDKEKLEEAMLDFYTQQPEGAQVPYPKLASFKSPSFSGPMTNPSNGGDSAWRKTQPTPGGGGSPQQFMTSQNHSFSQAPKFTASGAVPAAPAPRPPVVTNFSTNDGDQYRDSRQGWQNTGYDPRQDQTRQRYVTSRSPQGYENAAMRIDPRYGGGWAYANNAPAVQPQQNQFLADQNAVVQSFPSVGQAGTPENQAFVQAYQKAKASGQPVDLMQLATSLFGPQGSFAPPAPVEPLPTSEDVMAQEADLAPAGGPAPAPEPMSREDMFAKRRAEFEENQMETQRHRNRSMAPQSVTVPLPPGYLEAQGMSAPTAEEEAAAAAAEQARRRDVQRQMLAS